MPRLKGGLDEKPAVPPERAARPESASSVAPVASGYEHSLRPCLGTTIAPRRRALFRQTVLALAALCLALLAGCGGKSDKTVAEVGRQRVTQQQLDALVAHFRREAQQEGKDFPEEGSRGFVELRNQLLGLLVYRTELQQAADRLGVKVNEDEVRKRLTTAPPGGEEEGDANGDTYARDAVEAELLREGIAAKVTRHVTGKTLAERSASRNAALSAYLAKLQRETKVRYEPGYAPGS